MKKFLKSIITSVIAAGLFIACDKEKDFDIPEIKVAYLFENFEGTTYGSGSTEVPINLKGWANYNLSTTGTRLWNSRLSDSNKYAEFSSFYSAANTTDEAWLITPNASIDNQKETFFSFDTKVRFWTGSNLTVLISENYDGTKAGMNTATWTPLNVTLPTATTVDKFISSGTISLAAYKGKNIRIAFKYVGNKTSGLTTTCQLDNIKLFMN
ncbi:choice-of-anchor J domain-containing protein [Flavobacterium oreochromis]|uniref:DUF5017 domain-containing protein n=1 Tax=Flavobacterium columnare TaxID=996 RepID=A0A246GCR9_9FLAO|nr:choice-of-anchor J domain-containing protein [Flavobacterium oreochromis]OWP78935.1 hypothetical protein BWK62_04005 [Flavobacterium oreochromis]